MNKPANIAINWLNRAAGLAMALALITGCSPSAAPSQPPTNTNSVLGNKTNTFSASQGTNIALIETNSVFDDKLKNGRDPFFPVSNRQDVRPVASTGGTAVAPSLAMPRPPVELALVLNGILGTARQRVALINDKTFETGDEFVVHTTNGQARVRCMAISAQSVTITVNGKPEQRKLVLKK